jgi:hypothetical protein
MTVTVQIPLTEYTAAPGATIFATSFRLISAIDLQVQKNNVLITSGFTVTGTGQSATATVTFSAPMVGGENIKLRRAVAISRENNYQFEGDFQANVVNEDFDRLWLSQQEQELQINENNARNLRVPVGEVLPEIPNAAARANKIQAYNSVGDPIAVLPETGTASDVLIQLANETNTSLGATLIGWIRNAGNALGRTVSDKLSDIVNIKDFAGADSTAKLTAASAASKNVHITSGTFNFPTTPVVNGVVDIWSDAVISGPGLAAIGYTSDIHHSTIHNGTTGTDFATRYIRRNAFHTGGTPGYASTALDVTSFVGANATNFEWNTRFAIYNYSTAGENTGSYIVAHKMNSAVGPTIAAVCDYEEVVPINNPATSGVGLEVDNRSNGTDNLNSRVGVDVFIGKRDPVGVATEVGHAYRVQTNALADVLVKTGYGFFTNTKTNYSFDASQSLPQIGAYKMAQGQNFIWSADNLKVTQNDGSGIAYRVSGVTQSRISNDGGIELFGLRTKIFGTFSTGATTATLGANKPGATTTPSVWLRVDIDGIQGVVPWWPL